MGSYPRGGPLRRLTQNRNHLTDLLLGDDERWSEHHQVTGFVLELSGIGPYHQAKLQGCSSEPLRTAGSRWERPLALPVLHELDAGQEPSSPDITDVLEAPERLKPLLQHLPHLGASFDETMTAQVLERGHSRRAERRVVGEGLRVHEGA